MRSDRDSKYLAPVVLSRSICCVVVCALFFQNAVFAAGEFPYKQCHLESGPATPITAILKLSINAPSLTALQWILFNPAPPELPQQKLSQVKVHIEDSADTGQFVKELSPEHRYLFRSLVSAKNESLFKNVKMRTTYQLSTFARELKPGAPTVPPEALPDLARKMYTAPSETVNYSAPEFQTWLQTNRLLKSPGERDIEFAWRAFWKIRKHYNYYYEAKQDKRAATICGKDATDCGGLSWLLVGTLRANGIPARSLVGRWTKKDAEPDSANNGNGQCHVKSEFYANGIGWVPVEMSGAVSNKAADPLNFFGKLDSNFVVLHTDTDLTLDTVWFGLSTLRNLQQPAFWVKGSGSVNGYTMQVTWQTK